MIFAGNISHELNMSIIEDLGKYLEMLRFMVESPHILFNKLQNELIKDLHGRSPDLIDGE